MTELDTKLPRWVLPAILVLIAGCFALRNLPWHLDDYDQAKQAFVSFEMVQGGAWGFQHTPVGKIATKPPMAGWVSAGLAIMTGQWDLAWRLPPFLAALGILGLLVRAGGRAGGELGALLAASAFGLNLMAPRLATLVRTDMLLCLTIFLAGYLVYERLRNEEAWTTRSRWQLFGLLLASMLIKGPMVYAFLLPGLAAMWWLGRRTNWAGRAWSGWWSWLAPLAFFGVWVGLGIWLSRDFYDQVVLKEFLGRFEGGAAAVHKPQPIYFYITNLLHRFFPWSVVLLALAVVPEVRSRWRREPATLWLICWALGGLLLMSFIPSKRADRVFSILPPLALLLAHAAPTIARRVPQRAVTALIGLALIFAGGYTGFKVIRGYVGHDAALAKFGAEVRAKTGGERLIVVSGKDEGMLLYIRTTHFTRYEEAARQWQAGEGRTLVLPRTLWEKKRQELEPCMVTVESEPSDDEAKNSRYVLLQRPQ